MGKTIVNVTSPSDVDLKVIAVVAIAALGTIAIVVVAALAILAGLILGALGIVGLVTYAGLRLRSHQIDAQAALALWRLDVQAQAQRAVSESQRHALLVQLADPPTPRVALAMRKLQNPAPDPARGTVTWKGTTR